MRFRAPKGFRDRLDAVLDRRGHGDASELLRDALVRYLDAEEARLGIKEPPPPGKLAAPAKQSVGGPSGVKAARGDDLSTGSTRFSVNEDPDAPQKIVPPALPQLRSTKPGVTKTVRETKRKS